MTVKEKILAQGALLWRFLGFFQPPLLRCIHARAREKGVPALCVTANQFIRTARQAIFQRSQEDLDALYETELLLLDDLGTEPLIENVTVEELFKSSASAIAPAATLRIASRESRDKKHSSSAAAIGANRTMDNKGNPIKKHLPAA